MITNLSPEEFVSRSLELNLFFLRIMKEHAIFLEAGFPAKDKSYMDRSDRFKADFGTLLAETVGLANGHISQSSLNSGQFFTNRTMDAEKKTQELSGIPIDTDLTAAEMNLTAGTGDASMEEAVRSLNQRVLALTRSFADFKKALLADISACQLFNWNFPGIFEHMIHEADNFQQHLEQLDTGNVMDPLVGIVDEKVFWDKDMAEHLLVIAHYLDPSEMALIKKANKLAAMMMDLDKRATDLMYNRNNSELNQLVVEEIKSVTEVRDFKFTGEELILECKVKSVLSPLLADHVVREANYFLYTLEETPRMGSKSKVKTKAKNKARRRR
ncbi:MAG: DUF2935 domain-containing protein [Methylocystaceae bacterium]